MSAKITIIVPVYKVEKYLDKCIQSIQNQSFTDFELLLIDDGSPDSSGEICDRYANNDARIKVFHRKNQGIAKVRSFGISQVNTDYVCFVDSDDYILKDYLKCLYNAVTQTNAKIAMCRHINFQDGEREPNSSDFKDNNGKVYVKHDGIDEYISDLENTEKYVCVWNKIYHKSIWENIDFPEGKIYEDMYVWYKLLDKANDVAFIDDVLYIRRLNEGSITHQPYSLEQWYMVDSKIDQLKYFREKNKQRLVEISYDSIMHFFWENINQMKENNINDSDVINTHRNEIKKLLIYLKPTDTYSISKIIKQYYIAYLKKIA